MKKSMLLGNLLLACCLVLILLSTSCNAAGIDQNAVPNSNESSASKISIAPLNPAFVQYQEELEKSQNDYSINSVTISSLTLSDSSGDVSSKDILNSIHVLQDDELAGNIVHPTGIIPSPVDLSHLSPVNMEEFVASEEYGFRSSGVMTTGTASYPSRYDLRDNNGVTEIRDQGNAGSCWAHSGMASLESYLLHSRSEDWDFSENNAKNTLVYFNQDGFDRPHYGEGLDLFTAAYLTRWDGPVLESDDPYNDLSGSSPSDTTVAKHVQEIMILPGINTSDNLFKWILTDYGAISVGMWHDNSFFNSDNNSYYCYDDVDYPWMNHYVTLVGWDDNFDRHNFTPAAPGNGAFIIKNSWGDSWGEDGYFYISYYDSVVGSDKGPEGLGTKPYISNFMFTAENVSNYDHIYQYDSLGWAACTGYNNTTAYGANIFTASSNETLEAVSFYTVDSNSFYNISVYLDPKDGPVNSSALVSVKNGSIPIAGYHTIDLDDNVSIQTGQNFSVVVQFTTLDYNNPIAIEMVIPGFSSNAHAETGQSYMSLNGTEWEDISEYNKNACIKAFTTEEKKPEAGFVAGTRYVHVNETVDFHDASLYSPDTWQWDFGDNSTSVAQNPLHTYSDPGRYNVSLNASNAFGSNISLKSSFVHVVNSTIVVNSSGTADFTTIDEAICAASSGDTIVVEPGNYNEKLQFTGDNISLVSSSGNPADVSVISPDSKDRTIVIIADNITISSINVSGGSWGIYVDESSGCNITNCYVSDNFIGIHMYSSQNNDISNCTMLDNGFGLMVQRSGNNYFADNSLVDNILDCMFDSEPNAVSTSNTIDGKPIYYLVNSSDVIIDPASNAGLVHLIGCSNITVQDIFIENNFYGFYLHNSSNITIKNCTANVNAYGVHLSSSDENTMYGCNISDNIIDGISLTGSSGNLIYNNYFNNIFSNVHVSGGASNEWNTAMTTGSNIINGTYLGGNFWAKSDGTGWSQTHDSVGNGFCQEYDITDDGNNTDLLPLTSNEEQQAIVVESNARNDNDGIRIRVASSTVSAANVAAMDSNVKFVGRNAEVQYVFTNKNTPVTDIRFEAETNEGYVMATVNLLNEQPESAPASPSVRVYQSMDIVLGDERLSSSGFMDEATIGFAVSKEWIISNDIDENSIRMEHYSDGVWDRLPTTVAYEDDGNIYFEAITTGFSPFIICADIVNENINSKGPDANIPVLEDDMSVGASEEVQYTVKDEINGKLLLLLALILVAFFGSMYYRKRSNGKI
ncbi:PGF-pre-PGF domain-containing protein [Methanococcoides orientis]|uniref:lectin like domain-containing protein n=1 Tax=Methanococcoides orientis TaxID=2822137 RepID=UPI001E387545|nr:lectin like domain-containing protein [Methanococcoides orientis]UGV41319.1 PGF-pre-PGF domain-containing protein [Methanococcoides orientis]